MISFIRMGPHPRRKESFQFSDVIAAGLSIRCAELNVIKFSPQVLINSNDLYHC